MHAFADNGVPALQQPFGRLAEVGTLPFESFPDNKSSPPTTRHTLRHRSPERRFSADLASRISAIFVPVVVVAVQMLGAARQIAKPNSSVSARRN